MKSSYNENLIIVRGAGEMASGVIRRLKSKGFDVIALEKDNPVCVRRTVCYASAFYNGQIEIEGIKAVLVKDAGDSRNNISSTVVPLLIDEDANSIQLLKPVAVIDGRMMKKENDTHISIAPVVIGLGPGFEAGKNCHAVVETNRGDDLGRVIYKGKAEEFTGVPAAVNSITHDRVLRAPVDGAFHSNRQITDKIIAGDIFGEVNGVEVVAKIDGIIRGLIQNGLMVKRNQKIGDIDPRGNTEICFMISDKAGAIGGGVLEALFHFKKTLRF